MMRRILRVRLLLALIVAALAGYALYASLSWPFRAALFPRVIGIPLLLLALTEMSLTALGREDERQEHAVDFELSTGVEPAVAARRTLAMFGWIVGFLFAILSLGFPLAVPLFVFLYLKFAGEKWRLALALALFSWLFIEGLFNRLLHVPMPPGWLLSIWN